METKDWILLLVPIFLNGSIIFILQKLFENRILKLSKREDIRREVLLEFWKKLQNLNSTFIQMNFDIHNNQLDANQTISLLIPHILQIIQYYDTNKYDLKKLDSSYNNLITNWNKFEKIWNTYLGKPLTEGMQLDLGQSLQLVKEANENLISAVRNKF